MTHTPPIAHSSLLYIHTHLHPLPTPCNPQVYLATEELGNSLDEVDALMKKHETVEKLLETQEQKARAACVINSATHHFIVACIAYTA